MGDYKLGGNKRGGRGGGGIALLASSPEYLISFIPILLPMERRVCMGVS